MDRSNAARGLFRSPAIRFLLPALLFAVMASPLLAELSTPRAQDRQICRTVVEYLERGHMSRARLDDSMSKRWLAHFLKTLDPMKVYFYQADVDQFVKQETELDDTAHKGDISFSYTIFNTYLKRVEEKAKLAAEFLNEKHDFTLEEEMVIDADAAKYPRTVKEARERWRKRIKYDLLVLKAEKTKTDDALDRLKRRYRSFVKRIQLTSADDLLEMYLTAMTTCYDPHTTYMSAETLENFRIQMRLQLDGIGASLRFEDGYTIVAEIVPGGAADREGSLKPDDRIVGVGQAEDGKIEDVVEMRLSDVVKRIRGKRGTIVRLEVVPSGKTDRAVYTIRRDKIELKGSEARSEILEAGKKANGKPFRVGVINLPSFYMDMQAAQEKKTDFKSTTRDVLKILDDPKDGFKAQGVDVVVLDLRSNGGGSLSEAIKLTGLFIDKGPVVQVKSYDGKVFQHNDVDSGVAWDGPLVVLESKLSASASEILAGAVQDYDRGLIIGDPATHGKGTVQSLLDLGRQLFPGPNPPNLGALKLTMQQFYRPNGDSTQRRGVLADVELPSVISHLDVGESNLDFALDFDKVDPAEYSKRIDVNDGIRNKLRVLSSQRIVNSKDFKKVLANVDRYLKRKDRTHVTLNEEKFLAERAEDEDKDKDKDKKDKDKKKGTYNRPVVDRNFYFEEILNITLDYLQQLNVARAG